MTYQRMPRIAFYTYTEWAFGAIHKALCKELYKHGIQADIIDWNKEYTQYEFDSFLEIYDVFVTCPCNAVNVLLSYGVPYDMITLISHGREELQQSVKYDIEYDKLKSFGVIANNMIPIARGLGITRDIKVVRNGVSFDSYYCKPSNSLKTIGYGSKISRRNQFEGVKEWKRGYLVQAISQITQTPLILKDEMSHLAMPSYYKSIDCLILSSTLNESCGLPLLEAASAGRVPLSTMVGINLDLPETTGYILPTEENLFVSRCVDIINQLKADPNLYMSRCSEAQEFARQYYDWSNVIDLWIDVLL